VPRRALRVCRGRRLSAAGVGTSNKLQKADFEGLRSWQSPTRTALESYYHHGTASLAGFRHGVLASGFVGARGVTLLL
jgi:hypothetical protein